MSKFLMYIFNNHRRFVRGKSNILLLMYYGVSLFFINISFFYFFETRTYARAKECVLILHDQKGNPENRSDIFYAVFLANLLGHWPQYEVQVRSIFNYEFGHNELCKATLYLGVNKDSAIPNTFLDDFLKTNQAIAWIGYGLDQLDEIKFANQFKHKIKKTERAKLINNSNLEYYKYIHYKGEIFFDKTTPWSDEHIINITVLESISKESSNYVVSYVQHSYTGHLTPFILKNGNKFIVTKMPFYNLEATDAYAVVADLLFDILNEMPYRREGLAFARLEDVHGRYDIPTLASALLAFAEEDVPLSIAHIPLFFDPYGAFGHGVISKPEAANKRRQMMTLLSRVARDKRNAIIWHGVTHQYGTMKNPYSGVTGHDYEFWDYNNDMPVPNSSHNQVISRLAEGLPVFASYNVKPRYWLTPHYQASTAGNEVFGAVFPWSIGRSHYYGSAFPMEFTLPAVSRKDALRMTTPNQKKLEELRQRWSEEDHLSDDLSVTARERNLPSVRKDFKRSEMSLEQVFPYEIYRDVYGQRVIPETLYYVSTGSKLGGAARSVDDMLYDAKKGRVLRDYWASFFFHPFLLSGEQNGGIGRYAGDTVELRKLFSGLRMLGFRFIGLPEFERELENSLAQSVDELVALQASRDAEAAQLATVQDERELDYGSIVRNIMKIIPDELKIHGTANE